MAKNKSQVVHQNKGMILVVTYLVLFGVNTGILYLAHRFFPESIVLGTHALSPVWALVHSMGALALIDTFAIPFLYEWEKMRGSLLASHEWMIAYLVLNFGGLWLISRFSEQFGLGVSSWYVVLALAIVLDVVQGIVMMQLEKMRTSEK